MRRLIIVGGGISGLAAAWAARCGADREGIPLEIVVLEREADVGGKARSERIGEWLTEAGPLGYPGNAPGMQELVRAARLEEDVVRAGPAAGRRYLVRDRRLLEIPASPLRFVRTGLLPPRALLRALVEPLIPRRHEESEESVWAFTARRLGKEVADRLVAPMVLGVFAGDARRLSLQAAFPQVAALEDEHGSLLRGAVARRRKGRGGQAPPQDRRLTTFREGLQSLPRALAARGTFEVRRGTAAESVALGANGRWRVAVAGVRERIAADAIVLATEAWAMGALLAEAAPDLAGELGAIPYPPVAVVALGYPDVGERRIPRGFGMLVPRPEGFRTLGMTWDGRLFPGRCGAGYVLVRSLLGGTFDPEIGRLDEGELIAIATREAGELLGIEAEPRFTRVTRWRRAIPQYEVGHLSRVARIERSLAGLSGLFLAGNSLYGSSFPAAAARGTACGQEAVTWLRGARSHSADSLPSGPHR